jgi:hypothetical protein
MHVVGKRIGQKRAQDKQLMTEAGYYSNAAKGLESEMARQGIKAGSSAIPNPTDGKGFIPGKLTKTPPLKAFKWVTCRSRRSP